MSDHEKRFVYLVMWDGNVQAIYTTRESAEDAIGRMHSPTIYTIESWPLREE